MEDNPLHRLLEGLGVSIEVLTDLESTLHEIEDRYIRFGRVVLVGGVIVAIACAAALFLGGLAMRSVIAAQDKATTAATRADFASARVKVVTLENRRLIKRLEEVAVDAQERGRRTDVEQCHEINALKTTIRGVLKLGDQSKFLIPRFRNKDCSKLPNMDPIRP